MRILNVEFRLGGGQFVDLTAWNIRPGELDLRLRLQASSDGADITASFVNVKRLQGVYKWNGKTKTMKQHIKSFLASDAPDQDMFNAMAQLYDLLFD